MADQNDLFAGGGAMGAIMRATDWSKTGLGPIEGWPSSLKTMLGVVLGSRFPMLLWWGPDLLHLYNDAYRPILRDKHPGSLGAPAAQVWAEVWDVAGPMAKSVQDGGPATWTEDLQLFVNNGRMAEETYFTFSYSPVPGDDGQLGGVLNTVQETTAKVQGERQIRMLQDLAARAAGAKSEPEAYRIVLEVLSGNELDLPFVLLYRVNEEGDDVALVGAHGVQAEHTRPKPDFTDLIPTEHPLVIEDIETRFGPVPPGRWSARPERAIVLPLSRAGRSTPHALLIAGMSPHRAFDDRYRRFFHATADQVMTVIANAREYELETKRAEALAELARAKTTFFSNVSHEFRTPLTLILGPVEDALQKPAKSLEHDDLQGVHRSAMRLLRLVNSLLDFSRLEAGRLQLTFVPTDLGASTVELTNTFRSLVERAGLKLVVDCEPLSEPIYVDPSQWEKIVLNLVSNAFKFTLDGEIAVGLRSDGDDVELTVRDTGSGIPADAQPHIFERFHRVEGARGRSFEGSGIGLSLVQQLVKLHGGTVSVSSVESQGSVFRVRLPKGSEHLPQERLSRARPEASERVASTSYLTEASRWLDPRCATAEPATEPEPQTGSASPRTHVEGRARILIADDNADMRDYVARLLSDRWHVEVAEDGEAALASARAHRPDLVLSDVMMPKMDGFTLLRSLRSDLATRDIPVVLLSARAGEEPLIQGLETGADDYLVKPFSARELVARVRTHLDMSRVRREWTRELERANAELEAFSYAVSHDLRAPLRHINGFADLLVKHAASGMDGASRRYLDKIRDGAARMGVLIDDLLAFSKMARVEVHSSLVSLRSVVEGVIAELLEGTAGRPIEWRVGALPDVNADPAMLRQVFANLVGNSVKYTSTRTQAIIEIGSIEGDGSEIVVFVRDNGVGFDMQYADKLFGVFQRLHRSDEFEGTGIGLANVRRIVERHGGRTWADGRVDHGAVFYFSLPTRGEVRAWAN